MPRGRYIGEYTLLTWLAVAGAAGAMVLCACAAPVPIAVNAASTNKLVARTMTPPHFFRIDTRHANGHTCRRSAHRDAKTRLSRIHQPRIDAIRARKSGVNWNSHGQRDKLLRASVDNVAGHDRSH